MTTPSPSLTTPESVRELMRTSKSPGEWGKNCDKVKADNGGEYPSFWYVEIVLSGLLSQVRRSWT